MNNGLIADRLPLHGTLEYKWSTHGLQFSSPSTHACDVSSHLTPFLKTFLHEMRSLISLSLVFLAAILSGVARAAAIDERSPCAAEICFDKTFSPPGKRQVTSTSYGRELTNAQRLARGLPLNPPTRRGKLLGSFSDLFFIIKSFDSPHWSPAYPTFIGAIKNLQCSDSSHERRHIIGICCARSKLLDAPAHSRYNVCITSFLQSTGWSDFWIAARLNTGMCTFRGPVVSWPI